MFFIALSPPHRRSLPNRLLANPHTLIYTISNTNNFLWSRSLAPPLFAKLTLCDTHAPQFLSPHAMSEAQRSPKRPATTTHTDTPTPKRAKPQLPDLPPPGPLPLPPAWKLHLALHGWAVIEGVLNDSECTAMEKGLDNFIETMSNGTIKISQPNTWRNYFDYMPSHGMLLQHYGVGGCQAAWDVRQNPKVFEVFAQLHGTKDLVCSSDGLSFGFPPEVTQRGWHQKDWLHTDQAYARNSFEGVQSWLTAHDVEEGDATLHVLDRSHIHHGEFARAFNEKGTKDWFKLTEEHTKWYEAKGCKLRQITCPKGSMVLWDSRTVHAGKGPTKGRNRPDRFRRVVYVCMAPASRLTPKLRERKVKGFLARRTTRHNPVKPTLFGLLPRTYGKSVPSTPLPPIPELTPLGASLAGFKTFEQYETAVKESEIKK